MCEVSVCVSVRLSCAAEWSVCECLTSLSNGAANYRLISVCVCSVCTRSWHGEVLAESCGRSRVCWPVCMQEWNRSGGGDS
jgi:hypothetical protein